MAKLSEVTDNQLMKALVAKNNIFNALLATNKNGCNDQEIEKEASIIDRWIFALNQRGYRVEVWARPTGQVIAGFVPAYHDVK